MPFHALQQRGLLAEDVAARRGEDVDRDVVEQAGGPRALELLAQHVLLGLVLVADEHPALLRADRAHRDQHALDDQMRLLGEDLAVLERARLRLVGVAHDVLDRVVLRADHRPLLPGREPGAAHPLQARVVEHADRIAGHGAEHAVVLVRARVRVVRPPALTGPHVGVALLHDRHRRLVAAAHARDLMDGRALRDHGAVAREPAREVAADGDLERLGRRGAEVRVERDEPLDLVQRPAPVARELDQLLARQPAVLALDRGQRGDQRRAGELARARLDAGDAAVVHTRSTRTAQNLNSGIFPTGSISSIVSRFAAASRKWNGMKHEPGVSR